jgi:hypothetical protein
MINEYGLKLDKILDQTAGSYMQTVRYHSRGGLICPKCGGFKGVEYPKCYSCNEIEQQALAMNMGTRLADRIAAGVYAAEPMSQTLKMMYGYKDEHPASPEYRRNIKALIALAVIGHGQCLNMQAGMPLSAWAMVPSTKSSPRYGRPHPLHDIISGVLPAIPEIRLASERSKVRSLDPDAFALCGPPVGRCMAGNVLLIDDSWVTGGTVQSAAARLKLEGAAQVSIYCVARIVSTNFLESSFVPSFWRSVRYVGGFCPWNRCRELEPRNVQ